MRYSNNAGLPLMGFAPPKLPTDILLIAARIRAFALRWSEMVKSLWASVATSCTPVAANVFCRSAYWICRSLYRQRYTFRLSCCAESAVKGRKWPLLPDR
jgi:hypothetical protein